MARKNPLSPVNKLVGTAFGALKDPKGAAEKAVEQAKGTAALGKMVAEGVAGQVVDQVSARTRGRRGTDAPHAESAKDHLRAVPGAGSPEPLVGTPERPAQGDPTAPVTEEQPVAAPAPAKKAPAKKTPAKKAAPADDPVVVATTAEPQVPAPLDEVELAAPEPEPIVRPTKYDREAAKEASPADVAKKVAKKAPAKKAAAKKAPAKKATAKKAAAATPVAPAGEPTATPDAASSPGDKLPPRGADTAG